MKQLLTFLFIMSMMMFVSGTSAQDELLTGSNMEHAGDWQSSVLNSPAGGLATANWGSTENTLAAGTGGNLYVSGTSNNSTVQYCIYQAVNLTAGKNYVFDGAFKILQSNNSWCEVFIGTQPADGSDYGEGQFRLAALGTWAAYTSEDGTFSQHLENYASFIPDTTGSYYFVLKMGSTSWDGTDQAFAFAVDELSLSARTSAPLVAFEANALTGLAPFEVQFTDQSVFAESWEWNFGDGTGSSDQNPVHVYESDGIYTVSLTASNATGSTELVKTDYITVNPGEQLIAGGVLSGGEMNNEAAWQSNFLATPEGSEPLASWNDMEKTPGAGREGALHVSGISQNSTVQYCIYQMVNLSKDYQYEFNGAFRDFTANLNQAWVEVYIGTEPIEGLDYSKDDPGNFMLAEFSTWSTECNPKGLDGTFLKNACNNKVFIPEEDGEYFFVLKLGSTDWEGKEMPFAMSIDELSLTAQRIAPVAAFTANNPLGFAPLSVQFTDHSTFAESWTWDFGDGNSSTEQNPMHTYENVGSYTVTLTVSNEVGSTVLEKANFIKANEKPELPEGEMLYGGNMEDPNLWNITELNATAPTEAVWNYTDNVADHGQGGGLYLSAQVLNNQALYCIWQQVELKAGMKYTFDAAFKDLSENLDHFWSEVFIGTSAPVDGADYGEGHSKIAFFNSWTAQNGKGIDGTYLLNGGRDNGEPVGIFVPETDGTYYFAIKTGAIDWENTNYAFKVLIDEVHLTESENVPPAKADFFADITEGAAPVEVFFTDLSENAISWAWDFGDGNTSTEQSPSHTYTMGGIFTVSLVVSNGEMSDTLTVNDLITVTGGTSVYQADNFSGRVYPNPSKGVVNIEAPGIHLKQLQVFDLSGRQTIPFSTQAGNENAISIRIEKKGWYLLRLNDEKGNWHFKVLIQ